ncbi:DUF1800 domain-containing protein [Croceibacterium ferulae]|uniref:DUF1800 domain-containing protein n=1 Tax=Croceibacterium ferulae TaxID=1854641 RepID=UPI00139017C8|nr:DUF1800 family protein [Croceibacterium ferulae]
MATSVLAFGVQGCGGGDGGSASSAPTTPSFAPSPSEGAVLKPANDAEAARFLLHAGLSASTSEIAALRRDGFGPWLMLQMQMPNDQTAAGFFAAGRHDQIDERRAYDWEGVSDAMIWSQLLSGGNGVRKRIALALSELFVVSMEDLDFTWRSLAMGAYWDLLNEHVFGNYRDLLEALTLNPAMGAYLNTQGNQKSDVKSGRSPDENFAREVMQLFSIGLHELNTDGSLRLDAYGQPIEIFSNEDVVGLAKVFTGYNFDYSGLASTPAPDAPTKRTIWDPDYVRRPMTADPKKWIRPQSTSLHSAEEKRFLSVTIPAGTDASQSLEIALDTLFNHRNVAPFFCRQMIQRLVTSNPTAAYVQRIAQVFENNGHGRRGDLRAVFQAILLDTEALSAAGLSDPRFGKVREPMLRLAHLGRTFAASSTEGWAIGDLSNPSTRLGQAPLRSPSVFNFYRPRYAPARTNISTNGMVAPEFQIINETSAAAYVNFMEKSVDGSGEWMTTVKLNYAEEVKVAHDATALINRLSLLLTADQLTSQTRQALISALSDQPVPEGGDEKSKLRRVHTAVFLIMVSPDYIIQR